MSLLDDLHGELCFVCGTVISDVSEVYALVPDSSAIHPNAPKMDGQRFVVACTEQHLEQLRERFAARPFTNEELWAGKVLRAFDRVGAQLQPEQLAAATGLSLDQIERAAAWLASRATG
ncbi:MAG TPA: hypothetical protein VGL05_30220 [Kribbella sp.]